MLSDNGKVFRSGPQLYLVQMEQTHLKFQMMGQLLSRMSASCSPQSESIDLSFECHSMIIGSQFLCLCHFKCCLCKCQIWWPCRHFSEVFNNAANLVEKKRNTVLYFEICCTLFPLEFILVGYDSRSSQAGWYAWDNWCCVPIPSSTQVIWNIQIN